MHQRNLEDLFPNVRDREALRYFAYHVLVNLERDGRLSGRSIQAKVKADIRRIRIAGTAVERLRGQLLSVAYDETADLLSVPAKLRKMADQLEAARRATLPGKKAFSDGAVANLVSFVWETKGSPWHKLVAEYLAGIPGFGRGYSKEAHEKWVERHGKLIERQREWIRQHFVQTLYEEHLHIPAWEQLDVTASK